MTDTPHQTIRQTLILAQREPVDQELKDTPFDATGLNAKAQLGGGDRRSLQNLL